ncbi:right-handed parallel beta-helix repeat-containing protein [Pedobacter gandavensis]|uniref:Right-handed parallel beta-helix repeat-containing protein n=1 Tax=Pedobacter gandavensis TaxID=2679963 RepID=A0ABR6F0Q9_9SPHI|nr:right-handed parallel beta-helix repeat-containing protein [Pedobacter gandavensis]MBB2151084.1 right-handed parallel beta-helix repeat-containing protein [Pedobacter gandavensis]
MKATKILMGLTVLLVGFSSCKKANSDVDPDTGNGSAIGEVSGIWKRGSTQVIKGDIIIPEGQSLTIEEGVTVVMDTLAKPEIIVKGNLYAEGTAEFPIRFTIPEDSRTEKNKFGRLWGGILAAPSCAELLLNHTIIEYAGSTTTAASTSVKMSLYKAKSGENLPAIWFSNVNGKLVITNSTFRNLQEDCTYIEGGKIIFSNNLFYTTGLTGGEAINLKSGCLADVAYNLVYSTNTNALKLSNSGDRNPQTFVVAYNNTFINTGWRRPTAKGGSIWVEATVRVNLFNNLFANTRFGIKRDTKNPEDARSLIGNNLYYGESQTTTNQFQPSADVIAGVNDIIGKTAGSNDPKFLNYPVSNPVDNPVFNTAWNFHLTAGSPAIGKGKTDFFRHHAAGLILNGNLYSSPAPASYIGAYASN